MGLEVEVTAYSWLNRAITSSGFNDDYDKWGMDPGWYYRMWNPIDNSSSNFLILVLGYDESNYAGLWSLNMMNATMALVHSEFGTGWLNGYDYMDQRSILNKYLVDHWYRPGGGADRYVCIYKYGVPFWSVMYGYPSAALPPTAYSWQWINWQNEASLEGYSVGSGLYSLASASLLMDGALITKSGRYIAMVLQEIWSQFSGPTDIPSNFCGYTVLAWSGY